MPCHSDRVRRNYHTVKVVPRAIPSQDLFSMTVYVSRHEIASHVSKHEMRRLIMRQLADTMSAAWPEGTHASPKNR